MIDFRHCSEGELRSIEPYEGQTIQLDAIAKCLQHSVVMLSDGRPIAAAGAIMVGEGIAEIWSVLSEEAITTNRLSLLREGKAWFDDFQEDYEVSRLQSLCLDRAQNTEWLELFGFKVEDTYFMYTRVREVSE